MSARPPACLYHIPAWCARLLNDGRHTDGQTTCRYRRSNDSIGANAAVIPYFNPSQYFGPSTNHHVVTDEWSAAPTTEISQGDTMIDGAAFADDGLGVDDD